MLVSFRVDSLFAFHLWWETNKWSSGLLTPEQHYVAHCVWTPANKWENYTSIIHITISTMWSQRGTQLSLRVVILSDIPGDSVPFQQALRRSALPLHTKLHRPDTLLLNDSNCINRGFYWASLGSVFSWFGVLESDLRLVTISRDAGSY